MCTCKKWNWKTAFFVLILMACFVFAQSAVPLASGMVSLAEYAEVPVQCAVPLAEDSEVPDTGVVQSQELILKNKESSLKDDDLDALLHRIKIILAYNDLGDIQKQFHWLFNKENPAFYSCPSDNPYLDENFQTINAINQGYFAENNQNNLADVQNHNRKSFLEKMHDRLGGIHGKNYDIESHQSEDLPLLSPTTLYKKGYNFILSANYIEAEKVFCAFQNRYQEDSLSDDALFLLAEALLGQKRYYEAAQVYLIVWYKDKRTHYGSEILLKLAISMADLGHNKEACALFSIIPRHYKTLEYAFNKRLKKERSRTQCLLD